MAELNFPENLDKDELLQLYQAAMTLLDNAIIQWSGMTTNQKNAWIGTNFDAILRIQRGMLRLLGKMIE